MSLFITIWMQRYIHIYGGLYAAGYGSSKSKEKMRISFEKLNKLLAKALDISVGRCYFMY